MQRTISFTVDGTQFFWAFRDNGELLFFAEAAPEKLGIPLDPDDWDIPTKVEFIGNSGSCANSLRVIRAVTSVTLGWLESHHPSYLWIRCSCPKKLRVLWRLVDRYAIALGYVAWNDGRDIYLQRELIQREETKDYQID